MSINEPGEVSSPQDTQGDGPVTLSDRTEPGGQGSPGSNQAKAEPLAVPDLDHMNVGGADPQAPRHPDALRSGTSATGAYAHESPGSAPTRSSGEGESATTDTSGTAAAEGTSQEHQAVKGIRLAEQD